MAIVAAALLRAAAGGGISLSPLIALRLPFALVLAVVVVGVNLEAPARCGGAFVVEVEATPEAGRKVL